MMGKIKKYDSFKPTVEDFEQRIRLLTDALGVVAVSSGMAAITNVIMSVAGAGSNLFVTSGKLALGFVLACSGCIKWTWKLLAYQSGSAGNLCGSFRKCGFGCCLTLKKRSAKIP